MNFICTEGYVSQYSENSNCNIFSRADLFSAKPTFGSLNPLIPGDSFGVWRRQEWEQGRTVPGCHCYATPAWWGGGSPSKRALISKSQTASSLLKKSFGCKQRLTSMHSFLEKNQCVPSHPCFRIEPSFSGLSPRIKLWFPIFGWRKQNTYNPWQENNINIHQHWVVKKGLSESHGLFIAFIKIFKNTNLFYIKYYFKNVFCRIHAPNLKVMKEHFRV